MPKFVNISNKFGDIVKNFYGYNSVLVNLSQYTYKLFGVDNIWYR